ncbi:MAG: hypothetical protein ABI599_17265, partial [Flavobacteriales bacterium]
ATCSGHAVISSDAGATCSDADATCSGHAVISSDAGATCSNAGVISGIEYMDRVFNPAYDAPVVSRFRVVR